MGVGFEGLCDAGARANICASTSYADRTPGNRTRMRIDFLGQPHGGVVARIDGDCLGYVHIDAHNSAGSYAGRASVRFRIGADRYTGLLGQADAATQVGGV